MCSGKEMEKDVRWVDPPMPGTAVYDRVIAAGCRCVMDEYNGDGSCDHGYPWICDKCPIVVQRGGI